jgi:hypothetical protein
MPITQATQNVIAPNICTTDTAQTVSGEKSFTGNVTTANLVNGTSLCYRNKIINGNFDIWQRGTSLASGTGERFLADRFNNVSSGSTNTASQQSFAVGQTDVPNNPSYFIRTVVSSVAGVGNYSILSQRIESVRSLAGKTVTLSFYAKADSNKSMSIDISEIFGSGGGASLPVDGIGVKFNLTTSWQKFTTTVTLPSIAGKTIGSNNNDCIQLTLWFDAGSNFNSRTNSLGQQSGTFDIAQVQLEEGSVATPFEVRPIGTELALCQRYYTKDEIFLQRYSITGNFGGARSDAMFKVSMRSVPTLTIWSGGSIKTGTLGSLTVNGTSTSSFFNFLSSNEKIIVFNSLGLPTEGDYAMGSFEASAEL